MRRDQLWFILSSLKIAKKEKVGQQTRSLWAVEVEKSLAIDGPFFSFDIRPSCETLARTLKIHILRLPTNPFCLSCSQSSKKLKPIHLPTGYKPRLLTSSTNTRRNKHINKPSFKRPRLWTLWLKKTFQKPSKQVEVTAALQWPHPQ